MTQKQALRKIKSLEQKIGRAKAKLEGLILERDAEFRSYFDQHSEGNKSQMSRDVGVSRPLVVKILKRTRPSDG